MGKSTISMAIFNNYVKLPGGKFVYIPSRCILQLFMHLWVSVCVSVCYVFTCSHRRIHAQMHLHVHMHRWIFYRMYVHVWIDISLSLALYLYIYIYIYIHILICMHASIHTYIHTYIPTYLPTYIHINYIYIYYGIICKFRNKGQFSHILSMFFFRLQCSNAVDVSAPLRPWWILESSVVPSTGLVSRHQPLPTRNWRSLWRLAIPAMLVVDVPWNLETPWNFPASHLKCSKNRPKIIWNKQKRNAGNSYLIVFASGELLYIRGMDFHAQPLWLKNLGCTCCSRYLQDVSTP